ncbi:hypothetical protein LSP04_08490 [Levilactobacillus spicheri]|uniref:Uncharacterized protein n=1 Tax=Levilactobacillus spicheri TaxID=216463 RepID=A0ABQ0WSC1_9LACO|nr:hypothetical protein LSP04_08490 [Levilactobacillus spicheri]
MPGTVVKDIGCVDAVKVVLALLVDGVAGVVAADAGTAAPRPNNKAANPLNKVTRNVRFIISTPILNLEVQISWFARLGVNHNSVVKNFQS